ncbi:MAG: CRTAC1 family protein [Planctomycetota bacterium]
MRLTRKLRALVVGAALAACDPAPDPAPPSAAEDDIVEEARARGLTYVNRSGAEEKPTILEANGAGVAAIDLESDGDLDLVFTQGLAALADVVRGPGADVEVYVNDGRGAFARRPGPGLSGWWTGLATGDVDGDGDTDLVVAGFGDLVVLVQDERGELLPRTDAGVAPAGLARLVPGAPREKGHPPAWTTSVALFDADRDGALDLYAAQYLDLDPLDPPLGKLGDGPLAVPCRFKGHDVYCGPVGLTGQRDRFLRGRGDGTFEDVSARWLEGAVAGYALGVLPFDADGDGDTDVFVGHDSAPNVLWINDGGLNGACRFRDLATVTGVALSMDGRALASMGVAAGDVDRDGALDCAITNFSDEPTQLYLGTPRGFDDATFRYALARDTLPLLSWSVHLVDLDGDGWLELFTANGHVYPQADRPGTGTRYGQAPTAWRLGPEPKARRIEPRSERSLLAAAIGARGSAVGDFDLDGAPDIALVRIDAPVALGMNRMGAGHHRLAIRCIGDPRAAGPKRSTTDAHGARVIVVAGSGEDEEAWLAEVQTAAGYQSASTPWLHFGLGARRAYAHVRVEWPSGRVDELPGGATDRRLVVREGRGLVSSEAFR